MLFKDAPDLRSDFRIFMPDRSQLLDDEVAFGREGRTRTNTPTIDLKGKSRKLDVVASGSSGHLGGLPAKRKRKLVDRERERERELVPMKAPLHTNKVSNLPDICSPCGVHGINFDKFSLVFSQRNFATVPVKT